MKTPDEIKKGLASCSADECHGDHTDCPYIDNVLCIREICGDAQVYIRQLERERDAAVEQMKQGYCCCHFCKHHRSPVGCAKEPKLDRSCFEWRGAKDNNVPTNGGVDNGE